MGKMSALWFIIPPALGFAVTWVIATGLSAEADKGKRAGKGALFGGAVALAILVGILVWAVSNDTGIQDPFAGPSPTPTATLVPALQQAITLQTRMAEEAAQRSAAATLEAVKATATAMAAPAATPSPAAGTTPPPP